MSAAFLDNYEVYNRYQNRIDRDVHGIGPGFLVPTLLNLSWQGANVKHFQRNEWPSFSFPLPFVLFVALADYFTTKTIKNTKSTKNWPEVRANCPTF
jgi:hypothetical protein